MIEQVTRKISGKFKVCIIVKHVLFGDDLLYCAEQYAVMISQGSEDDYFEAIATTTPNLPIWCAQNNAEDIGQVGAEGFKVDDNNNPALEIIPVVPTTLIKEADKEYGQPLDHK